MVPRIHARDSGSRRALPRDFEDVAEAVVVKTAHRVEIGRERIAVSCLQLLDEAFQVRSDDLLCGLPLLLLFGVLSRRGDGGGGGYAVHGCFLLGLGRCFSCHAWHVPTCRTPPGEGGAARRKGSGYRPPAARRRARSHRVIFSEKKLWGNPLRRARAAPSARLG